MQENSTAPTQYPPFSVVIPTLGGAQVVRTIMELNRGTLRPAEILICIPEEDAFRVAGLSIENVRVLPTAFRGQVAQRAAGFRHTLSPLVMQLDDDILLAEDAVEVLVSSLLSLGRGNIVGPVYYNSVTGEPLSRVYGGLKGFIINVYETTVRGLPWGKRRIGALSDIGGCGSVDPRCCDGDLVATSWLPGGCSVSFREDLILDAFFPYRGKAYSEDILHSTLRTKGGIAHHVALAARATILPPERGVTRDSALAEIRARLFVAQTLGGNRGRAAIAAVLDIVRRQVAELLSR